MLLHVKVWGKVRVQTLRVWLQGYRSIPIQYLAKPHPKKRAWGDQLGKKTMLSLTPVQLCAVA